MQSASAEQSSLKIFTWRGFGLAWDEHEAPVPCEFTVAAPDQTAAAHAAASWQLYQGMVETLPQESSERVHHTVASLKPGSIFFRTAGGDGPWVELTERTPRLPPSARGAAPLSLPVVRSELAESHQLFEQVRAALGAGESAAAGVGKLPFMDGLTAVAMLEEQVRLLRGQLSTLSAVKDLALEDAQQWIQTYSLRKFYPLAPDPRAVWLPDIAHALSMQCRFTGHVHRFYSVAEHSVRVSILAEQLALHRNGGDKEAARLAGQLGLLHDSSEAYLIDVARPVKRSRTMAGYRKAEALLQETILVAFGLPTEERYEVEEADQILLATEARDLFPSVHPDWKWTATPLTKKIHPLPPEGAEAYFRARFLELAPWPMSMVIPQEWLP